MTSPFRPRTTGTCSPRAMQLLASAPEATTHRLAYVLRDACEAHPPTRLMVDNAIDRALATGGQTSVTPVMVLVMWEDLHRRACRQRAAALHRLVRASTASSGGRWRP